MLLSFSATGPISAGRPAGTAPGAPVPARTQAQTRPLSLQGRGSRGFTAHFEGVPVRGEPAVGVSGRIDRAGPGSSGHLARAPGSEEPDLHARRLRRVEICRLGPRQHGDPTAMTAKATIATTHLGGAVGEALVEEPDAQDDADEGVDDDQKRLGHAQRAGMKGSLLEQGADDSGRDEGVDGPPRQHAADAERRQGVGGRP